MKFPSRGAAVCDLVAEGVSLKAICTAKKIRLKTLTRWLADCPSFRRRYAQARRLFADRLANEVVGIADDLAADASEDELRRSRVRIDARKWISGQVSGRALPAAVEIPEQTQELPEFDFGSPDDPSPPDSDTERP